MSPQSTIAIVVMAMVALGGVPMTPVQLLRVIDAGGAVLVCALSPASSPIALTFTHSMYGGDVTESYVPAPGGTLRRTAIVAANAAAAEYYAWDGNVRATDEGYEVMAPDLTMAALPVRVDQVGNHRLTVGGKTYDLARMVDGSAQVWLAMDSRPLATQVFGEQC